MTRYLMNSATIPHGCPGWFSYRLATIEDLVTFLQAGAVISAIAYQDTLELGDLALRGATADTTTGTEASDTHPQAGVTAVVSR